MKSRALAILVFTVVPASAQMRVSLDVPSAPVSALGAFAAPTALGASTLTAPSLAPAASLPALAAIPSYPAALAAAPAPLAAAAVPAAAPAASAPAGAPNGAASSARELGAKLASAPKAAAPALSAAFDGAQAAASVPVDAASEAPRTPEEFAREGRRLFEEVRRAEKGGARIEEMPSDGDLSGRLERLPGTNPERERYVVELFKLAGAKAEDIVLQDIGHGKHNIMVVKKGKTDRVIVVGGHHDKVEAGLGAIDNGTGSTMVANLYQALHDQDTDATIVFVAFGREEEGLLGSAAYLRSLSDAQKSKIDAMINLDTLGVNGTFSWKNNSTRALLDRVKAVAAASHRDLVEAHLDGGDADSSSFREAGIPAITIYGASEDVIFDIIHTDRDTMAAFDLGHYKNSYLLTLDLIKSLDGKKLGAVPPGKV